MGEVDVKHRQTSGDECATDAQAASDTNPPRRARRISWRIVPYVAGSLLAILFALFLLLSWSTRPSPDESASLEGALSSRGAFEPLDVLLVGVDRTKRGTRRADTMLLLRVDALHRRLWLLSVPRDTNVGSGALPRRNAPACKAALAQATLKHPERSAVSDGVLSSAEHDKANPASDHRFGNAFDLTHDPENGVDCGRIAEAIRRSRDPRVKYVIFDGRCYFAREGWRWRRYEGSDQHSKHMHVSVLASEAEESGPWPGIMYDVSPRPLADLVDAIAGAPVKQQADGDGTATLLESKRVKANSAYSIGGPALAIDTVERVLELPVHHYAEVDFAGVTAVVDALGGVEVDVPSAIVDPKAADASPGKRARELKAGRQVLDGEHALTFVRSRHYWDADFGRVRSQQLFVKAAARKAFSPSGLLRVPAVARAVKGHAMSDLSAGRMMMLAATLVMSDPDHRTSATLVGPWKSPVVQTDRGRARDLVRAMRYGEDFLPMPSEITVTVLNGSGEPGAARRAAALLAGMGFRVARADNASSASERTSVFCRGDDEQAAIAVARILPNARLGKGDTSEAYDTRVLVVIGKE